MAQMTQLYFDREGDVLYLTFGDPRAAVSEEVEEDVLVRVDSTSGEVVGLTILNLSARFGSIDAPQTIPLNLEVHARLQALHGAARPHRQRRARGVPAGGGVRGRGPIAVATSWTAPMPPNPGRGKAAGWQSSWPAPTVLTRLPRSDRPSRTWAAVVGVRYLRGVGG